MRATCAAVVALLIAGCGHRPPAFDPSHLANLSCRQVVPAGDAPPVWISPADAGERASLARWCDTVGAVIFHPRPAAADRPLDRLVIVSWNIHEDGGDVDDLMRRLRRGEFTGGEPVDAFVLLLQEATRRDSTVPLHVPKGSPAVQPIVVHRGSQPRGVDRFAGEGLAVMYAPSMRNGDSRSGPAEDRGNAIVSTLPLLEPRVIELPLERQRRVAAVAAVEGRTHAGSAWHIELANVHLDTALALFRGGPFAARRRQASALVDAMRSSRHADITGENVIVVAGDLNTWMGPGEPAVRMLAAAFAGRPGFDRVPTWRGPFGLHATLDYIFVRGATSATRVTRLPSQFGSDHFPMLTIVTF